MKNKGIQIGNSEALRIMFKKDINKTGIHSAFYFDDAIEAAMRHEIGHIITSPELLNLMSKGIAYNKYQIDYGITQRAKDNIFECIAENFTLYSKGITDNINPDLLELFKSLEK